MKRKEVAILAGVTLAACSCDEVKSAMEAASKPPKGSSSAEQADNNPPPTPNVPRLGPVSGWEPGQSQSQPAASRNEEHAMPVMVQKVADARAKSEALAEELRQKDALNHAAANVQSMVVGKKVFNEVMEEFKGMNVALDQKAAQFQSAVDWEELYERKDYVPRKKTIQDFRKTTEENIAYIDKGLIERLRLRWAQAGFAGVDRQNFENDVIADLKKLLPPFRKMREADLVIADSYLGMLGLLERNRNGWIMSGGRVASRNHTMIKQYNEYIRKAKVASQQQGASHRAFVQSAQDSAEEE